MSHDYGWRDSCAAGGVTAMVVGSGALLGFWFGEVGRSLMCVPPKHSAARRLEPQEVFIFDRRRLCGHKLPLTQPVKQAPFFGRQEQRSNDADRAKALWHAA